MQSPMNPTSHFASGPKKSARLASRYEHIEARVQAMKEEFYAYRKRQAAGGMNNSSGSAELESACWLGVFGERGREYGMQTYDVDDNN